MKQAPLEPCPGSCGSCGFRRIFGFAWPSLEQSLTRQSIRAYACLRISCTQFYGLSAAVRGKGPGDLFMFILRPTTSYTSFMFVHRMNFVGSAGLCSASCAAVTPDRRGIGIHTRQPPKETRVMRGYASGPFRGAFWGSVFDVVHFSLFVLEGETRRKPRLDDKSSH